MSTKLSISVGSISVNGKPVAAISGFSYEGPVEGLTPALEAHANMRQAVAERASSWQPTRVQAEALHAIAAAGYVTDEGKLGCFAGPCRIKRVTFEVFRQRGIIAEGAGNTFTLTEAGRALEQEIKAMETLCDRCRTIADEANGPHPVMDADDALTQIEKALFDIRQERDEARGSAAALLSPISSQALRALKERDEARGLLREVARHLRSGGVLYDVHDVGYRVRDLVARLEDLGHGPRDSIGHCTRCGALDGQPCFPMEPR